MRSSNTKSRANCEIAASQRALTSRTASQGSSTAGPCILASRSSSPFDCHHPGGSCRSSSFPPRFSYLAQLVQVGPATVRCKVPDGRRTRCGAQSHSAHSPSPSPIPGPRVGPVVSVFPADFLSSRRRAPPAVFAPSFLVGSRAANVYASRTPWPCVQVGDLRSGLSFLSAQWVAWASFPPHPSLKNQNGQLSDPHHNQQTPDVR